MGFFDPSTGEYFDPSVDRRVVLITGANSGIGYYTALHLYLHGYVVYIAGRTESKVLKAMEDIKEESKKRIENSSEQSSKKIVGELHFIKMDLQDLSTVVKGAEEFKAKESKLHILVNNAGIMAVPFEQTKDGYDVQYQVNYLSHALLSFKVLAELKAVAQEGKVEPRVIFVSSLAHASFKNGYEPGDLIKKTPEACFSWIRYGKSKMAEIQFIQRFAKENPGILGLSVHPGIIITDLYQYWSNVPVVGFLFKSSFWAIGKVAGVSSEQGALATLRAAMDPSLTIENDNCRYFSTGGTDAKSLKASHDKNYIDRLYTWTIEELENKGFLY